ncbi:Rap1a/Tai family immunity protein [Qipengyuania seohaensis]|uniref:Rap1a/Tai family immunity protein n=1 Tax=Qipengyuania seohaensis TaxID=266951 RepID=UPI0012FD0A2C|nr:Rap1a/Tai family immunity protein [Qipengyuania seohaensis]
MTASGVRTFFCLVAASCLLTPAVHPQESLQGFQTAGDLLAKCTSTSSFAKSYCFAYIAGVADAARSYKVWLELGEPCVPAGSSQGQLVDVFTEYMTEHPQASSSQAASVVITALHQRFPCEPIR